MIGHVRGCRRVAGRAGRLAGGASGCSCRGMSSGSRLARLGHGDLAARPRLRPFDSSLRPVVVRVLRAEVMEDVLRAVCGPGGQQTVVRILECYPHLEPDSKQQALQTLASRSDWAARLVDAVESGQVDPRDLTAYTVRQIHSLNDADLTRRIRQAWGEIRTSSAERQRQIERLRTRLTPAVLAQADRAAGQAIFHKQCATCHRFFGRGGAIGPDLTGSDSGSDAD